MDKSAEKVVGKKKMSFFLKKMQEKKGVFLIYFSLLRLSGFCVKCYLLVVYVFFKVNYWQYFLHNNGFLSLFSEDCRCIFVS